MPKRFICGYLKEQDMVAFMVAHVPVMGVPRVMSIQWGDMDVITQCCLQDSTGYPSDATHKPSLS